jgi:hypothetical protein
MSRFILVAMMVAVTVAGCNRFPDNGLQIRANLPPDDSCLFSAEQDTRLLRGSYDISYRNALSGEPSDYIIAPLLESYLVSNALEFQGEQNNLQVDNFDITILLPDGSPLEGVVNPYRVDTTAILEVTEGSVTQEVAAAIGIPASYQSALVGIPSVILSIRAGGTTFGGFSQRSAPFRWPVDICEGCFSLLVCTPELFLEQCLPGQDGSPGCLSIADPLPVTP